MFDLLIYFGQSALCLAALYLIYKVAMSHETLHIFNRVVLLGSVIMSALLPLCRVKIVKEYDVVPTVKTIEIDDTVVMESVPELGVDYVSLFKDIAVAVFAIGFIFMLLRLLVSTYSVWRLIHSGERSVIEDDVTLTVVDKLSSPFSWFGHIVASKEDMREYRDMIISHELAHIRLRHSWDVLFADLALCLWWFNPAMWLLRRELQALHEYQADDAVLNEGVDAKNYQILLIKRAAGARLHSVANCLNHSNLKNRITMMCKKNSSRWAATKALLVLPVVAISLSAFATTVYVPREVQDKVTENSVNNKEYKPAIIEIKGSEIYLNNEQVTVAELEAVIEEYRLQTLIYDENDAASKRTYEAIHNTLKLNGNIDAIYSNGKRPEIYNVRIADGKIYLNDEQVTIEQLKAKADENPATLINLQADADTSMGMVADVKNAFRSTSHAVKVNYYKEDKPQPIYIVDGKVIPIEDVNKIDANTFSSVVVYKSYKDEFSKYGITEEQAKNGVVVIELKKDGDIAKQSNAKSENVTVVGYSTRMKSSEQFDAAKADFEQAKDDFKQADKAFKQAEKEFAKADKAFKQMEKDVQQKDLAYIKVEKMPTFQGGDLNAFRNWVQGQIQYPKEAMEKNISGRVIFSFVVEKDGSTSDFIVLQAPDKLLADEVERIFKTCPKWEPGTQRGEKVRVKYTVPIVFAVQGGDTASSESLKAFNLAMEQIQKGDALEKEMNGRNYKDAAEQKADQQKVNNYYKSAVGFLETAYQLDSKHKPTLQALRLATFRLRDEAGMMAKYEKYKAALEAL